MTDWMTHQPFGIRFALIAGAIFAISYAVAWLLRRPLGPWRENIAIRLIAYVLGVWAGFRAVALVVESGPYLAGLMLATLPVFILTPLIADLVRRGLSRRPAARGVVIAATAGTFLLGAAALGLAADREMGERSTRVVMVMRHLNRHFFNDPSWRRIADALRQKLPGEFEKIMDRNQGTLFAALKSGDHAAIERARTALASDFFDLEMREIRAVRRGPDAALVRYARAQQALLKAFADRPEACAALAGIGPASVLKDTDFTDAAAAAGLERSLAVIDAISGGRRPDAPVRTSLTVEELQRLRSDVSARLPAPLQGQSQEAMDAAGQCQLARTWWDIVLTRPAPFIARAVAQIYPPLIVPRP